MKPEQRYILMVFTFVIILLGSCAVLNKQYAERRDHNQILNNAIVEGAVLEIECNPLIAEDNKKVKISDSKKVRWLLERFKLPVEMKWIGTVHACVGHMIITIYSGDTISVIRYDHGTGQYPISLSESSTSFVYMDPGILAELNQYFLSLGFTEKEIGID